ncbi:MAG TPA: Spy/CpxP family protein refolding chaperone [Burkholderiaceae bacterium]|jgi:glutamine synthetase adenylyltransferase
MKQFAKQYTGAKTRIATAMIVIAAIVCAPSMAFAADKDAHEDRVELRIRDMHEKLKITATQETQWGLVAAAMRDDAKTMDTLTQTRFEHAKEMTAVDDLKSYGEIAMAHADGVKKLTPVFAELYNAMSDSQKKEADTLFRHGVTKHMHKG